MTARFLVLGCLILTCLLSGCKGGSADSGKAAGDTGADTENDPAKEVANNLKLLTLAMQSFNDQYRRMPAPAFSVNPGSSGTAPLLSWRVAILPFIEEEALYKEFKLKEAWDSPHNAKLLSRMPRPFQPVGTQPKKAGHTYLQLVTGPGTVFPKEDAVVRLPFSFPEGMTMTLLIVEAAEAVPWTKPADVTIDVRDVKQTTVPKLGALSPDGFHASLADGSAIFINRERVSDQTICQLINPTDGLPLGDDWEELNPWKK